VRLELPFLCLGEGEHSPVTPEKRRAVGMVIERGCALRIDVDGYRLRQRRVRRRGRWSLAGNASG
jgi:hypothetical protein